MLDDFLLLNEFWTLVIDIPVRCCTFFHTIHTAQFREFVPTSNYLSDMENSYSQLSTWVGRLRGIGTRC